MKIKTLITTIILLVGSITSQAQTVVTGKVTDQKGETLPGANVYIKDTFDGSNTNTDGSFSFETEESGAQVLIVSFVGFKTVETEIQLTTDRLNVEIVLPELINKIDGVTIAAGAYEASDIKKVTVLKPLDIVTTASAAGDIMGALNTLPGTATVGESGRLFVRGGEGYETKVFIDGMEVRNAFGATAPNVPTRGRFSPFLFKGTVFSTGGYSAEYGQALSSALVLNSNDFPLETQTDLSLMSVGGDVAYTKAWDKTSVSGKVQYTNLRPYQNLISQYFDWEKAPLATVGEVVIRQKINTNGLLKVYVNGDASNFSLRQPNINNGGEKDTVSIKNNYLYINSNYRDIINKQWSIKAGFSATSNKVDLGFNQAGINDVERGSHTKVALSWDASEHFVLNMGAEYLHKRVEKTLIDGQSLKLAYSEGTVATFAEGDYFASNKLVLRMGLRAESSTLLNKTWLNPRIGAAYKVTDKGQFSFGYGKFLQSAQNDYSIFSRDLRPEEATHYILNYQHIHDGRVFRVEAYRKEYDNLVKFESTNNFDPTSYSNNGFGTAEGVDVFWRDSKTFKDTDYWISYSYVDSKRDYQNFDQLASPSFLSRHNFSYVVKHFVQPLRTQFGATYQYASTRLFHNPNRDGFQNDGTPEFHDLSLNAAVLIKQNIILYLSSSNVLGRDNVFGYEYANTADENGVFQRQAIRQGAKRFIFAGLFITLTKGGQENQLRNL